MPAVEIVNFTYIYPRKSRPALSAINLSIPVGAFWGIIGPTGAGKTTLCRCLAGLIPHYFGGRLGGNIIINGQDTASTTLGVLSRQVGLVLDDYESQLVSLTVEEEIAFALENRGLTRQEMDRCLATALAAVELTEKRTAPIATLSGGQKQRLVIAAALAARPALLVLDEPSASLDPEGVAALYHLLDSMRRQYGLTVVLADHRTEMLGIYADQLVLLTNGTIAAQGQPQAVFEYMLESNTYAAALPPVFLLSRQLSLETLDENRLAAALTQLLTAPKEGEAIACSA